MKLYVSHSPANGKIKRGTFKVRWSKSIKDQKTIGGKIVITVYGDTKQEVNDLAAHLVEIYNMEKKEIVDWLQLNKDELSFNRIETKNGIPQGTLSKVVKGKIKLPKKWEPVLIALQKRMCGGKK